MSRGANQDLTSETSDQDKQESKKRFALLRAITRQPWQWYRSARRYRVLVAFWKRPPRQKFVIFGQGKSGSTLLTTLFNSHPEIHCDQEILFNPVKFPKLFVRARCRAAVKPVYGFKVKIYQLNGMTWTSPRQSISDPSTFLRYFQQRGWKIIYLRRENLLRTEISNNIRWARGNRPSSKKGW